MAAIGRGSLQRRIELLDLIHDRSHRSHGQLHEEEGVDDHGRGQEDLDSAREARVFPDERQS